MHIFTMIINTKQLFFHHRSHRASTKQLFFHHEDKIAEATKLPQVGERWLKGSMVNKKKCLALLMPLPDDMKLKIGVLVKFMKPEWRVYYEILVRYVSCDGRYSHLHLYHL